MAIIALPRRDLCKSVVFLTRSDSIIAYAFGFSTRDGRKSYPARLSPDWRTDKSSVIKHADASFPEHLTDEAASGLMGNKKSHHAWLCALGRDDPPAVVTLASGSYRHLQTFKHDFFAATAVYEGPGGKAVLKMGRRVAFFGLPTAWIGRWLTQREGRMYQLMSGIDGVPAWLGFDGPHCLAHAYVEGAPLNRRAEVGDDFFPRLSALIGEIHARGAAYVDLEKPENILLTAEGRPSLIDFQISVYFDPERGGRNWLARRVLKTLQLSDRYHLLKHWRRMRPDQLSAEQVAESYKAPFWIAWHRRIFRPLTLFRRWILVRLGERSSTRVRSPG